MICVVCVITDPIWIVVDVEPQLIVHGRDGNVILQVFGEETTVHHVEVKSVVQLHVHVAHQWSTYGLKRPQELKIAVSAVALLLGYSQGPVVPRRHRWVQTL